MHGSYFRDIALSAFLLLGSFVSADSLDSLEGFSLVERGFPLEKRVLEGRACRTGFVPCGNGYCRPTDGTCCANGSYADSDEICCSGGSAPAGSTCCPNYDTHARPGYYCCTDGASCRNGRTCRGCTPVNGGDEGGSSGSGSSPTTTSAATLPTGGSSGGGTRYYTYTITYTYLSWTLDYDIVLSTSTATTTRVSTTTIWSVSATDSDAADSSYSQFTRTESFFTPAAATVIPTNSIPTSTARGASAPTSTEGSSLSGGSAGPIGGVGASEAGPGYRTGVVAVVGTLASVWVIRGLMALLA
ncbi:hypothetical protein P152DRAFT_462190 [Eremomyces bilateralis CBS 781.70]|uniref:GPI anchored protein n=1 Tax=Eremomyces bilateralis CBS 781.70 TaxID=1392243 RepID=A0A6G1FST3_9PEZI|nr:uncharacterized protein P152DRAFT_462190 [Eremomyces bilateralis CBS 781.70]KAF1808796.1 hypothetical protein P152DRAFT_462190 [Eremomyces bilateralis CBS 781.70]